MPSLHSLRGRRLRADLLTEWIRPEVSATFLVLYNRKMVPYFLQRKRICGWTCPCLHWALPSCPTGPPDVGLQPSGGRARGLWEEDGFLRPQPTACLASRCGDNGHSLCVLCPCPHLADPPRTPVGRPGALCPARAWPPAPGHLPVLLSRSGGDSQGGSPPTPEGAEVAGPGRLEPEHQGSNLCVNLCMNRASIFSPINNDCRPPQKGSFFG